MFYDGCYLPRFDICLDLLAHFTSWSSASGLFVQNLDMKDHSTNEPVICLDTFEYTADIHSVFDHPKVVYWLAKSERRGLTGKFPIGPTANILMFLQDVVSLAVPETEICINVTVVLRSCDKLIFHLICHGSGISVIEKDASGWCKMWGHDRTLHAD